MKTAIERIEKKSQAAAPAPATQAFRVVLHRQFTNSECWVVHLENLNPDLTPKATPDFYWGHYFETDYAAAHADYVNRCMKYHLHP